MSDTSNTPEQDDQAETPTQTDGVVIEPTDTTQQPSDAAIEDGAAEAAAEAGIAELVEAERVAEAEERAASEAAAAAESEEPESEPERKAAPATAEAPKVDSAGPALVKSASAQGAAPAAAPAKPAKSKAKARPIVTRLAVLGSPIGHSKSPELHRAAYAALGLSWSYDAEDVSEADLGTFIDGLGEEWRGLSLTMPLKKAVVPLLTDVDAVAERTGVANTVLFDGEQVRGFNTDVSGIVRALAASRVESARYVHILGGGATAASALVASAELGAERVDIHVRNLEKSAWLESLAHDLGLMVRLRSFAQADRSLDVPDVVISTLPGDAKTAVLYTDSTRRRAVLLDAAYEPWPSPLATSWGVVGGRVISGLGMLAQQALIQVRIFVSGDPLEPLPDEDAVLGAMLDALGVDATGAVLETAGD